MFERCLYFNTNALTRKLNALWEKAFADFDLPPSHAYLLRLVLDSPGLTQQELANELRLTKSTITRFIAALESKGLVSRQDSPNDRRENVVIPTSKARSIYKKLEALGDELYAAMCETIGQKKVESFVKTARKITEKL